MSDHIVRNQHVKAVRRSSPTPRAAQALRVFALLMLLPGPVGTAAGIPMPPLAATEQGAYRALDAQTGSVLWETQWVLTRSDEAGRPILHLREDGAGVRDLPGRTAWTDQMVIDLWGADPRIAATRETRNAQQPLEVETRTFDYTQGAGQVETQDLRTGTAQSRQVPLTAQTIPVELLSAVLRLLPATPAHTMRVALVLRSGRVVELRAKLVGQEPVAVPAGQFDCFKLELDPTGMVGMVARLLMPPLYVWQTAAFPHFWVKVRGPDGGPGSREIVRDGDASPPRGGAGPRACGHKRGGRRTP